MIKKEKTYGGGPKRGLGCSPNGGLGRLSPPTPYPSTFLYSYPMIYLKNSVQSAQLINVYIC